VLTEGLREYANVIFPAESHAEKDGTVVHPDGRLQRLRTAIAHPGEVRPGWAVIAELAAVCGVTLDVRRSEDVYALLVDAVAVYAGITLEEIAGHGVRWPERPGAIEMSLPAEDTPAVAAMHTPVPALTNGHLALGTYRPLFAAPEVDISPALQYLVTAQHVELSPQDAAHRGILDGEIVVVAQNGTRLQATAVVRSDVAPGSAFLADGIGEDSANALTAPLIEVLKP
jgi:NADH-quinone oxidoreductase subunit G